MGVAELMNEVEVLTKRLDELDQLLGFRYKK